MTLLIETPPETPVPASVPEMRLLPESEWTRLFPLFADSFPDRAIPLPPAAACGVLELDGEIVAATFFTLVYHMEPAMARRGYGTRLWDLAQFVEDQLQAGLAPHESLMYYVTAPARPEFLKREAGMGRTVMAGHVPVTKILTGSTGSTGSES